MDRTPHNTRLRYVASKDVNRIVEYVNRLPYRVEIKGCPVFSNKKWTLFFILPDDTTLKEKPFGILD